MAWSSTTGLLTSAFLFFCFFNGEIEGEIVALVHLVVAALPVFRARAGGAAAEKIAPIERSNSWLGGKLDAIKTLAHHSLWPLPPEGCQVQVRPFGGISQSPLPPSATSWPPTTTATPCEPR